MICNNCGNEVGWGSPFCPECGTLVPMTCPQCGSIVEPDSAFCDECGTKIEWPENYDRARAYEQGQGDWNEAPMAAPAYQPDLNAPVRETGWPEPAQAQGGFEQVPSQNYGGQDHEWPQQAQQVPQPSRQYEPSYQDPLIAGDSGSGTYGGYQQQPFEAPYNSGSQGYPQNEEPVAEASYQEAPQVQTYDGPTASQPYDEPTQAWAPQSQPQSQTPDYQQDFYRQKAQKQQVQQNQQTYSQQASPVQMSPAAQPSQSTAPNTNWNNPAPQQVPNYPQPQNQGQGDPNQPKSQSPVPIIIIVAVVLVAVAAVIFILKPGPFATILGGNNANNTANVTNTAMNVSNEPANSSQNASNTSVSNTENTAENTSGSNISNASNTENAANTSNQAPTTPPEPARTIPGVGDVSTTQSAGPSDFNWVNADYAAGKTPADAIIIENPADMKGGWKAYTYGTGTEHLFHMDISAAGTDVSGVIHWSQVRDSSGNIHDDNTPDSVFSGTMIDGVLDATGPGRITLIKSWYAGNAEYAVGTFMWPSGETDTLVLMRP